MKKLMRNLALSMMFCLLFLPAIRAKAADPSIYEDHGSDNISVSWSAGNVGEAAQTELSNGISTGKYRLGSTLHYAVGIGSDQAAAENNANIDVTGKTSYTFTGLSSGSYYVVALRYYYNQPAITDKNNAKNNKPAINTNWTTIKTVKVLTKPNTPSNVRATSWSLDKDKIVIEWDMDGNYTGFEVSYTDSDKDKRTKTVSEKKVVLDTEYTKYFKVAVRAYVKANDIREDSSYSEEVYTFAQPLINEVDDGYDVKVKNGKLIVGWEKINQATGYEIYVGTKRNGQYTKVKTIKNKNTTSAKVSKFKKKKFSPKKEYFVYVIAYRKANGKTTKSTASYVVNYRKGDTYMTFRGKHK